MSIPVSCNSSSQTESIFFIIGFLGQAVCKRAALEGYLVTSISRRGRPPGDSTLATATNIEYLEGDCRQKSTIVDILTDGSFTGED